MFAARPTPRAVEAGCRGRRRACATESTADCWCAGSDRSRAGGPEIAEALSREQWHARRGADKPLAVPGAEAQPVPSACAGSVSRSPTSDPQPSARPVLRNLAAEHPLKCMFLMVATVEEARRRARAPRRAERAALGSACELEVGVMVEVPCWCWRPRRSRRGRLLLDRDERPRAVAYLWRPVRQRDARPAPGSAPRRAPRCSTSSQRWSRPPRRTRTPGVGVCGELAGDPAVARRRASRARVSMAGRIPAVTGVARRPTGGRRGRRAAHRRGWL